MNILESRLQKQDLFIIDEWSCDTDPYFREGFEILEEMRKSNTPKILCSTQDSTKRFLQLNMAYMLLWSMIDRYVTLRYHMLNRISDSEDSDYLEIANDKVFQKESDSFSPSRNKIFKSNSPDNYQYYNKRNDSDENNYKNRLKYFHQIRNNIVHRGKAYNNDIKLVYESLNGLLKIYKKVYKNALEESKWDN
ncbi:MAG: hypothetical protein ACP5NZ_04860 [Nanobdellota archaeon]